MPPAQDVEIQYSKDGPFLTFHGGGSRISFSLREWVRVQIRDAEAGGRTRILRAWLRAREAEEGRAFKDGAGANSPPALKP